jgi:phosphopantetheine--protein transferase-like protein
MKVGTDIVEISRLNHPNDSFLQGVYSQDELLQYKDRQDKAAFLAGHYAAKEAFLKALGTGLSGGKMKEIEVKYRSSGAPYILFKGKEYEISISHDGDYAIAVVIIL